MIQQDSQLAELLARHKRFWLREPAERPLAAIYPFSPLEPNKPLPVQGGRYAAEGEYVTPEQMDLDAMLRQWPAPDQTVSGDYLNEFPPYGLCWMEGLIGARVRAAAGTIWAEPDEAVDPAAILGDPEALRLRLAPGNAWYARLREYLAKLAVAAGGRVPVVQPLMRGPVDMVQALIGSEALALAVYDAPAALDAALDVCADAFVQVGRAVAELAPEFFGGHSVFGIWTPGPVIRLQADHASILSPQAYREHVAPRDARIAAEFDYSIFHLHSGNLHTLDALLEMKALTAVQVTLDPWPFAPRLKDILSRIAQIPAAGKSLELSGGPVSQDELDQALATLPPGGLALKLGIGSTWD